MNKIFLISFIFLLSISQSNSGQNQALMNSGKIVFEINYLDKNIDPKRKSMMPSQSILYFKGDKTRMELNMAIGNTVIISNNSTKKSTVLMDIFGNKIAMETTQEDAKKEMEKAGKLKVEKIAGSKMVAGYNCKKAKITQTNNGKDSSFDVWYTNEISVNNAASSGINGIDGCMLEFQIFQNGMRMQMTTKSITKQVVSESSFNIPDGYTFTTPEAIKSFMGGGFGK